jgi:EAL domain-containing protein (putative c-di-GMP-specific phosphodiesterase class I)
MLILLFSYCHQEKIHLNTEKAFFRMMVAIISSLIMDILSLAAMVCSSVLPDFLIDFVCKTYIATLVYVALCGVLYVCADIYKVNYLYRMHTRYYLITAAAGILLIYVLPIYRYCEGMEMYTYGPATLATYGFVALFFASILLLMQKYKAVMNPRRRYAIHIWVVIWLLAAVIQFIFKELLVVGFAGSIGVMVIYFQLENPEANQDRRTGLYNQNALLQYTQQLYGKEASFAFLSLIFSRSRVVNMTSEEENRVIMEVIRYLLSVPGSLAFKNAEDEVILLFHEEVLADNAEKMLRNRFDSGWGKEQNIFVHPQWIRMPDARITDRAEDILPLFHYARKKANSLHDNSTVVINQAMLEQMHEEKRMEHLIQDAIEYDRIEVYYQPIYSMEKGSFTSAEALIRLRDDEGNIIPPGAFIDIAERNGSILKLGEMVFERVCMLLQSCQPMQYGIQYIEVNLSVVQCAYEHLAENFIHIMKKYRIDPSWINLEITESASIAAKNTLIGNMRQLMDYGVSFSLDDFGTGQSNLNYIVDMPVKIVKFDRGMTLSYFENGKAKYVMDAAMHMIHGLKLKIVSEGIETKEQFDTMCSLGINYIQGYYFSRPLPASDFIDFIAKAAAV